MAYFANGSEGDVFDNQCAICKFGDKPCPIAYVQMTYNYDAVNNDTATKILGELVMDDGTCLMLKRFPELKAAPQGKGDGTTLSEQFKKETGFEAYRLIGSTEVESGKVEYFYHYVKWLEKRAVQDKEKENGTN